VDEIWDSDLLGRLHVAYWGENQLRPVSLLSRMAEAWKAKVLRGDLRGEGLIRFLLFATAMEGPGAGNTHARALVDSALMVRAPTSIRVAMAALSRLAAGGALCQKEGALPPDFRHQSALVRALIAGVCGHPEAAEVASLADEITPIEIRILLAAVYGQTVTSPANISST